MILIGRGLDFRLETETDWKNEEHGQMNRRSQGCAVVRVRDAEQSSRVNHFERTPEGSGNAREPEDAGTERRKKRTTVQ